MADSTGPLAPYRVLDLTDHHGLLCGKILADLGADVVRVEPPEGNRARRVGPFAEGVDERERSLHWWTYAANCRSVILDLTSPEGRARFLDLVRVADFLLESFPPGYLDRLKLGWATLHQENPRLILTSITPFGADGPYRDFKGPDLVLQAMGGMMNQIGDADRPPVKLGGSQAFLQAAGQAAVGTLVALFWRERTGQGQWVEVSGQVAMMWTMKYPQRMVDCQARGDKVSIKELLSRTVEELNEEEAVQVMEFIVALKGEEPLEPGDQDALAEAARGGYDSWEQVRKNLGLDVSD